MHSRICHLTLTDLLQELTVNSDSSHKPRGTHESPRLPETDADAFPWLASKACTCSLLARLLTETKGSVAFLNYFRGLLNKDAYSGSKIPPLSSCVCRTIFEIRNLCIAESLNLSCRAFHTIRLLPFGVWDC